jgi:hypothetical protein
MAYVMTSIHTCIKGFFLPFIRFSFYLFFMIFFLFKKKYLSNSPFNFIKNVFNLSYVLDDNFNSNNT